MIKCSRRIRTKTICKTGVNIFTKGGVNMTLTEIIEKQKETIATQGLLIKEKQRLLDECKRVILCWR